MIQPNELRIGNFLHFREKERLLTVSNIGDYFKTQDENGISYGSDDLDDYEPIPLTEEEIRRFGFKRINSLWYGYGNFKINISLNGDWGNNWMGFRLKSVHQLQNLVFALTGTELSIKQI